jgi:hypothetical protein
MSAANAHGRHAAIATLALFSRGDLSWLEGWKVRRHVAGCSACGDEVSRFRFATEELKREAAAQTLTGFEAITDWTRLEREMLGNIAVGVSAARCIDNVGRRRGVLLAKGAAMGGMALLLVGGWFIHVPPEQNRHLLASFQRLIGEGAVQQAGSVLRATPDGISVRAQGATLTILHPRSAVVSMSGASAVRARYVDEDSGEVTITSVYGQ